VTDNGKLLGIITDGDLRRMMEKGDFTAVKASDIMSRSPKTIDRNALAVEALELMKDNNISQLIVTDHEQYEGMIHLHDLIREGII
jgi:arabinose-5-phosphate isomerase